MALSNPLRRKPARCLALALLAPLLGGCGPEAESGAESARAPDAEPKTVRLDFPARLTARPTRPQEAPKLGFSELGLGDGRDGFVYAPTRYDASKAYPLLVMLHGANGSAKVAWIAYEKMAEERGVVLVAIDSRGVTWDEFMGGWGPDVSFIDQALKRVFARYRIDPKRVALGGFSDGASYALAVGPANGDLFTHVIAFAPGYVPAFAPVGDPGVFVSHGRRDEILPVSLSRDQIVPELRRLEYAVEYYESDLTHTVDWDITYAAMDWFLPSGKSGAL